MGGNRHNSFKCCKNCKILHHPGSIQKPLSLGFDSTAMSRCLKHSTNTGPCLLWGPPLLWGLPCELPSLLPTRCHSTLLPVVMTQRCTDFATYPLGAKLPPAENHYFKVTPPGQRVQSMKYYRISEGGPTSQRR